MYRKYFFDDLKFLLISCLVLVLAIIAGSIFCGMTGVEKSIEIKEYLTSFLTTTKDLDCYNTTVGALKEFGMIFIAVFISAFFKAGVLLNAFVLAKRGFVIGFTLSSFFKIFGVSGILLIVSMLPELLIFLPVLLVFSSNSTKMSVLRFETKKNFLFLFVVFSIFFGAIFCVSAFLNGYLTTIFMRIVSSKLL